MDMLEEKVELALELVVEEEEDDDDGPPPGFQCIIAPQQPENAEAVAEAEADDDGDGPPPGFHSIAAKPTQSLPSSDTEWSSKQDNIDDDDDDEDGPPPGWEFNSLVDALPKETSSTTGIKEDSNEELDDGPPPGWGSMLPCQMPPPCTPPLQPPPTVSCSTEIGKQTKRNDNEVPPSEPQGTPMPGHSLPGAQPLQLLPSSELPSDAGNTNRSTTIGMEKPTPGHKHVSPRQQIPPNPHPLRPPATSSSSEKCQLVCGTCRKLCVCPRGAKWVQCPGCKEVNFVLEAHEVGQVNCGGCSVLLMYPHGAPAVQCSSCRFVTEIGAHNRRPPLSIQQAQARAQRRRRSTNRAR